MEASEFLEMEANEASEEAKSERIGILFFLINERKYCVVPSPVPSYVGKLIGCLYLATT